jgi:HAD superfamily hydrolase (TIGR01509 family)
MEKNGKNEIRAVLFDWDGTLLDSYHADSQAYLALFRKMGIDWGLAELTEHYSPDWYSVYRAAGLPRRHWDEADRTWREHYAQHKPRLISGARRVLAALGRRHRLGLVTSGDRSRVTRQLREFRLTAVFGARVCGGDTPQRKPHPAPLQLALRRMRLDPRVCVYVGDSPEDLQMARRAGVRAIGVLGPFPTEVRLRAARPDLLLENLSRLPQALREFV